MVVIASDADSRAAGGAAEASGKAGRAGAILQVIASHALRASRSRYLGVTEQARVVARRKILLVSHHNCDRVEVYTSVSATLAKDVARTAISVPTGHSPLAI